MTTRSHRATNALLLLALVVVGGCTPGRSGPRVPLTVPETTTTPLPTTTTPSVRLETTTLSGVCPDPVVIQFAGPLDFWALPEVGAVAVDGSVVAPGRYVGALLDPRTATPTGIRLELRTAAALPRNTGTTQSDGAAIAAVMRQDPSILLGEVGLDPAQLAGETSSPSPSIATRPATATVGASGNNILLLVAPWERSDAAIVWDHGAEPDAEAIADLVGVVDAQPDPAFAAYLVRSRLLTAAQVVGVPSGAATDKAKKTTPVATPNARYAHMLADPTLLDLAAADPTQPAGATGPGTSFQLIDETGWEPYDHALGTLAVNTKDRAPCLRALVPMLQDATARLLSEPDRIVANAARIATKLADPFDVAFVRRQLAVATQLRIVGTGGNRTIGDIEEARVEQNIRAAATSRGLRGAAFPSPAKVLALARALIDRSFTDTTIGLTPRPPAGTPTTAR